MGTYLGGDMEEIKLDENNYRIHDDRNKQLINKSLKEYGAGRAILTDKDGVIIAGNGTFEQAKELGIPVKVIESDGTELIAVKRTDLATDDEKRKGLAIMDNSTTDSSKFDVSKLNNDFSVPELQDMGVPVFEASDIDPDEFFKDEGEKEKKKKTVTCPHCGEEFEL